EKAVFLPAIESISTPMEFCTTIAKGFVCVAERAISRGQSVISPLNQEQVTIVEN
ncbi:hypothetical protein U1Q18_049187, partial [Sarracenia purpurea var. burkii]